MLATGLDKGLVFHQYDCVRAVLVFRFPSRCIWESRATKKHTFDSNRFGICQNNVVFKRNNICDVDHLRGRTVGVRYNRHGKGWIIIKTVLCRTQLLLLYDFIKLVSKPSRLQYVHSSSVYMIYHWVYVINMVYLKVNQILIKI